MHPASVDISASTTSRLERPRRSLANYASAETTTAGPPKTIVQLHVVLARDPGEIRELCDRITRVSKVRTLDKRVNHPSFRSLREAAQVFKLETRKVELGDLYDEFFKKMRRMGIPLPLIRHPSKVSDLIDMLSWKERKWKFGGNTLDW